MQTAAVRYLIRPMNLGDIAQVMEIERESFPAMWPQTAFQRELQQNHLARYLVAQELHQAPAEAAEPQAPAAPVGARSGLGRFLADLRHTLSPEEPSPLPPPEARPQLTVGFVGVWLLEDEAHIVTIAVRESHRGRGIGELLLIAAIELAQQNQRPLLTLECRVSNTVALNLYEKYGFKQVGLRPRYYSDNHEDAYVLSTDRINSPAYRERFERLKREHSERWGQCQLQL